MHIGHRLRHRPHRRSRLDLACNDLLLDALNSLHWLDLTHLVGVETLHFAQKGAPLLEGEVDFVDLVDLIDIGNLVDLTNLASLVEVFELVDFVEPVDFIYLVDVVVDRRKNSTSTTSSKSFSFPQTNTAAITVICNDGRVIAGTLRGFDQAVNLILSDCVERVFSADAGTELQPLGGLHVIRGDNVAVVGEIDADKEEGADWGSKRAAPLPPVTH